MWKKHSSKDFFSQAGWPSLGEMVATLQLPPPPPLPPSDCDAELTYPLDCARCGKRHFRALFNGKMYHFTETGSGQIWRELKKRVLFRQARGDGQRPDAVEAAAVLRLQVRDRQKYLWLIARSESRAPPSPYRPTLTHVFCFGCCCFGCCCFGCCCCCRYCDCCGGGGDNESQLVVWV
jgi:hypothetical protein